MDYTLYHQGLFGESYVVAHPKRTETFKVGDVVEIKPKYQKMYASHNISYPNLKYEVWHVWEKDSLQVQVNIRATEEIVEVKEDPFRSEYTHRPNYDFVDIGWLSSAQ